MLQLKEVQEIYFEILFFKKSGKSTVKDKFCVYPTDSTCHQDAVGHVINGVIECFCKRGFYGNGTNCTGISESESEKLYLIRVTHSVCNILLSFGALKIYKIKINYKYT